MESTARITFKSINQLNRFKCIRVLLVYYQQPTSSLLLAY